MPTFYAVEVQKANVAGEFRVNDVPLYTWSDTKTLTIGQPVNMWMTGHSGRISFHFDWARSAQGTGEPSVRARVLAGNSRSQAARDAQEVALLEWPPPGPPRPRPPSTSTEFLCADPPPSLLWPASSPVEVNAESTSAAMAILLELNEALARKDVMGAAGLLRFKTLDVGRSMYLNDRQSADGLREYLEFCMDGPDWAMEAIRDDSFTFQTVAEGRLIWVTRAGREPALRSRAGRMPRMQLPVYLATVEGRWTVVR